MAALVIMIEKLQYDMESAQQIVGDSLNNAFNHDSVAEWFVESESTIRAAVQLDTYKLALHMLRGNRGTQLSVSETAQHFHDRVMRSARNPQLASSPMVRLVHQLRLEVWTDLVVQLEDAARAEANRESLELVSVPGTGELAIVKEAK